MGIGSLGFSELIVIFVIVLVFFGPRRFPEIARSMGHAMREFRRSLNQIQRELEEADPRSSIPGRDFLNDIRSGKPGKWLDPNAPQSDSKNAQSSSSPAASAPRMAETAPRPADPPTTGEAARDRTIEVENATEGALENHPACDSEEQLPMFGSEKGIPERATDDRPAE